MDRQTELCSQGLIMSIRPKKNDYIKTNRHKRCRLHRHTGLGLNPSQTQLWLFDRH